MRSCKACIIVILAEEVSIIIILQYKRRIQINKSNTVVCFFVILFTLLCPQTKRTEDGAAET
jgi:hypothetical protein